MTFFRSIVNSNSQHCLSILLKPNIACKAHLNFLLTMFERFARALGCGQTIKHCLPNVGCLLSKHVLTFWPCRETFWKVLSGCAAGFKQPDYSILGWFPVSWNSESIFKIFLDSANQTLVGRHKLKGVLESRGPHNECLFNCLFQGTESERSSLGLRMASQQRRSKPKVEHGSKRHINLISTLFNDLVFFMVLFVPCWASIGVTVKY